MKDFLKKKKRERNNQIKNGKDEIKTPEDKIKPKDLKYEQNKNLLDFQQFETIRSFGDCIYTGKLI